MKLTSIIVLALVAVIFSSCNVTRKLPQNSYLLSSNVVEIEKDRQVARSERIAAADVSKYIKQRPNKQLFGFDFYLWVYNQSNPKKDNWLNRTQRRIGEEPVIYDSMMTLQSVDAMSIYLRGCGFFNSKVDFKADTVKKRVNVTYKISEGDPYRIGKIEYDYQDKFLEPIIMEDSSKSLLHSGEIFNVDVLQKERQRITDYLKNLGYYTFNINNISYLADSTEGDHVVDLKMIVKQRIASYNTTDEPVMQNNTIYRVRDIYVLSDYNPTLTITDSNYYTSLDTITYRGVNFIYKGSLNARPDVLLRAINIYPNSLYNADDVKRAYDNVMRLNYFKNVNILFSEITDSTAEQNMVTFVGSGENINDANLTSESYLSCNILCTPGDQQSYKVDVEGTTTSNYYGLLLTAGYQNRNLFKGLEQFDLSATVGYEFMRVKGKSNSFEVGGATSFSFPRFITPFRVDRYNKMKNVRTKLEFSINVQNRPYYKRVLSSGAFGYTWSNNRYSSFVLKPIDISLVKMRSIDSDFFDSIPNPYLKNSYRSQLIAGASASYTYNNQSRGANINFYRLRVNAETNGNLIDLGFRIFDRKQRNNEVKELFGIQFAQYARADVNMSYNFVFGRKTSLVYRLYAGVATPYGNSTEIPFERLFYSGGPNSMRGWLARTLGPGTTPAPKDDTYPIQSGNVKLETNLEFRFPVYGVLDGAVFCDVGNVWLAGGNIYTPEAEFKFNNFYKQLGFDSGLGARFDFGMFVFRVDWGLKIHDPNRPANERWIRSLTLRQSSFNFGVDYPF